MLRCRGGCEAAGTQPVLALREATGSGGKAVWDEDDKPPLGLGRSLLQITPTRFPRKVLALE